MPAMAAGFPSETAVQFAAHLHVRGYLSYLLLQPVRLRITTLLLQGRAIAAV